jgi:hypothetical protein
MHVRHFMITAALLATATPALHAQAEPQERHVAPVLGFSVGAMSIESASATRSQVGDQSFGIQLDAGALVRRHFYVGMDVGGQFLKDHAQFTQNTTGGEMKSSAVVTYFSAVTGLRTGTLGPLALALNAGASITISRRSIDNCTDCDVDKLDIPGGAFVEPMLTFGRGSARLRVMDRVYVSGDGMRSVVSVGAEFQPRKKQ